MTQVHNDAVRSRIERTLADQYREEKKRELHILDEMLKAEKTAHNGSMLVSESSTVRGRKAATGAAAAARRIVKSYIRNQPATEAEVELLQAALSRNDLPAQVPYRSAPLKRSNSAPSRDSRLAGGERLHRMAETKARTRDAWARRELVANDVRRFLQEGCTFAPMISEYAQSIHRPKSLSPSRRLYVEKAHAERKRVLMEHRRDVEELQECTFQPSVCRTSTDMVSRIPGYEQPAFDRLHSEAQDRLTRKEAYARRPSAYSDSIEGRAAVPMDAEEVQRVVDRLFTWKEERDDALDAAHERRYANDRPVVYTSARSKEIAERRLSEANVDADVYNRLYSSGRDYGGRERHTVVDAPRSPPRPMLGPSAEMAERAWAARMRDLWKYLNPRDVDTVHIEDAVQALKSVDARKLPPDGHAVLQYVAPILMRHPHRSAMNFSTYADILTHHKRVAGPQAWMSHSYARRGGDVYADANPYRPSINPQSSEIVRNKKISSGPAASNGGEVRLLTMNVAERTQRRLDDIRKQEEEKAVAECTFQPKVTRRKIKQSHPAPRSASKSKSRATLSPLTEDDISQIIDSVMKSQQRGSEGKRLDVSADTGASSSSSPSATRNRSMEYAATGEHTPDGRFTSGGHSLPSPAPSNLPPTARGHPTKDIINYNGSHHRKAVASSAGILDPSSHAISPARSNYSHVSSSSLLTTLQRNDHDEIEEYGRTLMQRQLLHMNKQKLLAKFVKS
eukprot:PhM_4_TR5304/c0_g1_i1/m.25084